MQTNHDINEKPPFGYFLILAIVIGAGVGAIALIKASIDRNNRIESAKRLVKTTAALFDDTTDDGENFLAKLNPEFLPADPWGQSLRVQIKGDVLMDCIVTSAGPDKTFDTDDDITAKNTNFNPNAKAAGKSIGKAAGDFGIGLGKGLVESVKEEFQKKD